MQPWELQALLAKMHHQKGRLNWFQCPIPEKIFFHLIVELALFKRSFGFRVPQTFQLCGPAGVGRVWFCASGWPTTMARFRTAQGLVVGMYRAVVGCQYSYHWFTVHVRAFPACAQPSKHALWSLARLPRMHPASKTSLNRMV